MPDTTCSRRNVHRDLAFLIALAALALGGPSARAQSGACCIGLACQTRSSFQCSILGGDFVGGPCTPNPCGPLGRCCTGGACTVVALGICSAGGGTWTQGANCSPPLCLRVGSCCTNGECVVNAEPFCGGTWTLNGTCSPNPCPPPTGSCCVSGLCSTTTEADCLGLWVRSQACEPVPCLSACCSGGTCVMVAQAECSGANAYWLQGLACSHCTPNTCATAFTLREGEPAIMGDNAGATTDTPFTGTTCESSKDVWFSFTADADGGVYQFDTRGSSQPDTVLALFLDVCGGSSICTDDSGSDPHPRLTRTLGAGTIVKVRVASAGAAAAGGGFVLNIVQTAPAVGACCANTIIACGITLAGGCVGGTYQGDGTVCAPSPCPPAGACCGGSCCVVVREAGCVGTWTLGGACTPGQCGANGSPPANDACSDAVPLVEGVPAVGFNCTATDDGSASCAPSNKDVWYTFTAAAGVGGGGPHVFDTEGSQIDSVLALFNECGGGEVACDDDGGTGLTSRVELSLTPGQRVTIRVADFGNNSSGGAFTLNVTRTGGGACCCGASCSISTAAACAGPNRAFAGEGTSCTPYSASTPCCRADFNRSGGAPTVQDIFDFLGAYFAVDMCADTNDSGTTSVQDIFDFLAAYFAGCP